MRDRRRRKLKETATAGAAMAENVKPAPSSRDHAIDFLRGSFILSMALAHFGTPLAKWLNFRFLGFVNGAEGFVFLSGYVSGMVYGGLLLRKGPVVAGRRVRGRLVRLVLHIWLLLSASALVAWSLGAGSGMEGRDWAPMVERPLVAWARGLVFAYQPPVLDILAMYAAFLALLPAALGTLRKGGWRRYLAVSIGVYLVGSLFDLHDFWPDIDTHLGDWKLPGWQILFFGGVLIGSPFEKPSLAWIFRRSTLAVCTTGCAVLFFCAHPRWIPGITQEGIRGLVALDSGWAEKLSLRPLTLLNFLGLSVLFAWLHRLAGRTIRPSNPVAILGSSSLEVFSFHLLLLLAVRPLRQHLPRAWGVPLLALFLALLWIPPLAKRRFGRPRAVQAKEG